MQAFFFDVQGGTPSPSVAVVLASIEQVFVQALFATVVLFPVKYVSNVWTSVEVVQLVCSFY